MTRRIVSAEDGKELKRLYEQRALAAKPVASLREVSMQRVIQSVLAAAILLGTAATTGIVEGIRTLWPNASGTFRWSVLKSVETVPAPMRLGFHRLFLLDTVPRPFASVAFQAMLPIPPQH
jgi:hypothetical protein